MVGGHILDFGINNKLPCEARTFVTPEFISRRYTLCMPVQIGSTSHSFSNPLGLLSDCHRRVEMFLGALLGIARSADQELTADSRRSLEASLRYFREAAPKHTADEEVSLFPRLRKLADPEVQSALDRLDALESDHRWAQPLHEEMDALGTDYLNTGHLNPDNASRFLASVERLSLMYKRHIEVEESDVFPMASRILSDDEQREIGAEMALRRDHRRS